MNKIQFKGFFTVRINEKLERMLKRLVPMGHESGEETNSRKGTKRFIRHNFQGIPTSTVDVLVSGLVDMTATAGVISFGLTHGRYDGKQIARWLILPESAECERQGRMAYCCPTWSDGSDEERTRHLKIIVDLGDGVEHREHYQYPNPERADIEDPARVFLYQAAKYYGFLFDVARDDVLSLAECFDFGKEADSIEDLNRRAGRALYKLAKDLGWVKLTRSQKDRLGGTNVPSWITTEEAAKTFSATGCGFYTLKAASQGILTAL